MKTPGEAAYERWLSCLNEPKLKHVKELQLQTWDKQTPASKSIWEAVAEAAIEHVTKKG